jgi:hypothetical protein
MDNLDGCNLDTILQKDLDKLSRQIEVRMVRKPDQIDVILVFENFPGLVDQS